MIHYAANEFRKGEVLLDPASPAFRFGAGFFETLLYNGRRIMHLELHLERIFSSLEHFGLPYERIDFESVIQELVQRNSLTERFARINILYLLENNAARPAVLAAPYAPRPEKTYRLTALSGFAPTPFSTHKSMNHFHCHLARNQALAKGYDDAVLTGPGGLVLETASAALLFRQGDSFIEPLAKDKLPSTALALAGGELPVTSRPLSLPELKEMDHAYVLNSLIGMRPVRLINEFEYAPDETSCSLVSEIVLGLETSP